MSAPVADVIEGIVRIDGLVTFKLDPLIKVMLILGDRRMIENCLGNIAKIVLTNHHVLRKKVTVITTNLLGLTANGNPIP